MKVPFIRLELSIRYGSEMLGCIDSLLTKELNETLIEDQEENTVRLAEQVVREGFRKLRAKYETPK